VAGLWIGCVTPGADDTDTGGGSSSTALPPAKRDSVRRQAMSERSLAALPTSGSLSDTAIERTAVGPQVLQRMKSSLFSEIDIVVKRRCGCLSVLAASGCSLHFWAPVLNCMSGFVCAGRCKTNWCRWRRSASPSNSRHVYAAISLGSPIFHLLTWLSWCLVFVAMVLLLQERQAAARLTSATSLSIDPNTKQVGSPFLTLRHVSVGWRC
jgi:hypothetical protein